MSRYAEESAARLTRLMKRYGDNDPNTPSIEIERLTGATVDKINKTRTGGVVTTTPLVGLIKNRSDEVIDASRIKIEADTVHIDSAFTPLESDIMVLNGEKFTIRIINEINMGNTVVGYTIKVMK